MEYIARVGLTVLFFAAFFIAVHMIFRPSDPAD